MVWIKKISSGQDFYSLNPVEAEARKMPKIIKMELLKEYFIFILLFCGGL